MNLDKETIKKLRGLIVFTIVILIALWKYEVVFEGISYLFGIMFPFLLGGAIAFVLNVPMSFLEDKIFSHKRWAQNKYMKKLARPVSMIITILLVLGIVVLVMFVVVPELGKTFLSLGTSIGDFVTRAQRWLEDLFVDNKEVLAWLEEVNMDWDKIINGIVEFFRSSAGNVVNSTVSAATGIISGVATFLIAFVFACYILLQKEKLTVQIQKVMLAYLPKRWVEWLLDVFSLTYRIFSSFLAGQCLEALILGVMFFIEFIVRISSYAPIRLAAKVSPIEAVRASGYQAEGSKKTSRKSGKHLSPNYLAVMNFRRNPKKAVLTLLSLGMAGVFLFSTATVVHSVNAKNMAAVQMYEKCNYTIQWEADLEEFPEISRNNPLTPELKEKILAVDGVKSINSRASSSAFVSLPNGAAADFYLHTFTREEEQELLSPEMVLEGTADYDELIADNGIILLQERADLNGMDVALGDTVEVDYENVSGDIMTKTYTVKGIVSDYNYTGFDKCFTLPEQLINEGTGMDCTGTISVITDKDKFDTIETSLNQLIDKNSDLVMDTIEESVNYYNRNQQLVFGAFLIVAIIVVCFSLINLVNTTITNFLSRKQEIGMLQAIGLSKKQLIRMLCYEGMIYSLFAVLVTLILGVGLGILCIQIMRSLNPYFFYSFPWPVVLIYSAVLLAVQLILIAYTTGNLKKQSLVDQIKTME